ncbi:hypothetical protein D3C75_648780 [compost metagenome]
MSVRLIIVSIRSGTGSAWPEPNNIAAPVQSIFGIGQVFALLFRAVEAPLVADHEVFTLHSPASDKLAFVASHIIGILDSPHRILAFHGYGPAGIIVHGRDIHIIAFDASVKGKLKRNEHAITLALLLQGGQASLELPFLIEHAKNPSA